MPGDEGTHPALRVTRPHAYSYRRSTSIAPPAPGIAEPERREPLDRRRRRAAITDADADEDVFRLELGVLHHHVEIAALVEDPGVDQLVFPVELAPSPVLRKELLVRVLGLWVLIEILHVRMGRRVVQVVVVLLDVLAVVALAAGQAKQPLLEDRIAAVPERQGEAEILVPVADAGQAILVPTVGPRAGVIVREVAPGVAAGAVVLAHRAPRALRQERPPAVPVALPLL